ncbi:hypothetical protein GCM10011359_31220 [Nesterenkonia alkaliphila]|nr:hypothetical protein GCM10011359_31220 [Nesterenkonia alkaliphila]
MTSAFLVGCSSGTDESEDPWDLELEELERLADEHWDWQVENLVESGAMRVHEVPDVDIVGSSLLMVWTGWSDS